MADRGTGRFWDPKFLILTTSRQPPPTPPPRDRTDASGLLSAYLARGSFEPYYPTCTFMGRCRRD